MKTTVLWFVLTLITSLHSLGQVIRVNNDTTICPGNSVTLTATVGQPAPNPPVNTGINSDDETSGLMNIGFPFTFYGNSYTQCVVASNNYITFDLSQANGYSPWSITQACPSPGNPRNAIMGPWHDINPGVSGSIRVNTLGVAPNRVFVVEFLDIPMFSCTNLCFSNQIKLFEGTNVIETHIATKPSCSWNSGYAIHGLQNAAGTVAHIVPGRNYPSAWTTNFEGTRFTPNGAGGYTITTVPYNPSFINQTVTGVQWLVNGNVVGNGNSITVTPNTTTTYIARVSYSACNSLTYTDTVTVSVGNQTATSSPDTSICMGDSAPIWVTTTLGNNATYTWTPATGLSDPSIANPIATPTQTTNYQVTATNGICTAVQNVLVTVNPLPVVQVTPGAPQICQGDAATMTASGAASYTWTDISTQGSFQGNPYTVTPSATTTYRVDGIDANGCADDTTVTITFFNNPTISVNPPLSAICFNDTIGLTATGASTYTWNPAPQSLANSGGFAIVSPATSTTYTIVGTDVNNCKDTTTASVNIYDLPVVAFSASPSAACAPQVVQLSDVSQLTPGSGSVVQWNWTIEGYGNSNEAQPTVNYLTPGTYDVQLVATSNYGCTDTLFIPDYIEIYANPTAGFDFGPQPANIGDPTISFFDQSSSDVTYWDWNFAGLGTASFNNPSFVFPFAGEFPVVLYVENNNGCADTTTAVVKIDDLGEIWIPNSFTPNGDGLNDTFYPVGRNLTQNVLVEVNVFNRWGKRVYRGFVPDKPWTGQDGVNGEICPGGVYSYLIIYINENGDEFQYMGNVNLIR